MGKDNSELRICISQLEQIIKSKDFSDKIKSIGFDLEESCHLYYVADSFFQKLVRDIREEIGYYGKRFSFTDYTNSDRLKHEAQEFVEYAKKFLSSERT